MIVPPFGPGWSAPCRLRPFDPRRGRLSRALPVLALVVGVAACSPTDALNAFAPTERSEVATGLRYGDAPRQRLDVYAPPAADHAPVVVFFYGGRWSEGRREDYRFVGAALAEAGIVTIIPDYRLYPEVRFPAFVEDGAAAVAWALDQAEAFGGAPDRLYLMGHSAGAHIAALLALDRRYLGAAADRLAGWIGLAGPYDFLPLEAADLRDMFGPPERFPRSQPVRFARAGAPPALLLHGRDDATVSPDNSRSLAAALRDAGSDVRLTLYDGVGHAALVGALARPLGFVAPVREAVVRFTRAAGPDA